MFVIEQITSDPRQKFSLILSDGTIVAMEIYFIPMQLGWFITELTYGDFVLKGLRVSNSPNMLRQFQNQIPFGLACFSSESREPSQQEDFSSGNSKLFILTEAEVEQYEDILSGQIQS